MYTDGHNVYQTKKQHDLDDTNIELNQGSFKMYCVPWSKGPLGPFMDGVPQFMDSNVLFPQPQNVTVGKLE